MSDQDSRLSDEALMERITQRDERALSLLYDRYARIVYVMAAHLLSEAEGEEVVQEVQTQAGAGNEPQLEAGRVVTKNCVDGSNRFHERMRIFYP